MSSPLATRVVIDLAGPMRTLRSDLSTLTDQPYTTEDLIQNLFNAVTTPGHPELIDEAIDYYAAIHQRDDIQEAVMVKRWLNELASHLVLYFEQANLRMPDGRVHFYLEAIDADLLILRNSHGGIML